MRWTMWPLNCYLICFITYPWIIAIRVILFIFAIKKFMIDIGKITKSDAMELFRVCKNREVFIRYRHLYVNTSCTKEEAHIYWNLCLNLLKNKTYGKERI